jgi:hypothetical protein
MTLNDNEKVSIAEAREYAFTLANLYISHTIGILMLLLDNARRTWAIEELAIPVPWEAEHDRHLSITRQCLQYLRQFDLVIERPDGRWRASEKTVWLGVAAALNHPSRSN